MSRPQLGAEEYRSAAVNFIGIFVLLGAALMTTMSLDAILAPQTLLIIGAISLAACFGDLFIKYRRLQKGISTEDILRKFERDSATGQRVFAPQGFKLSMLIAGVAGVALAFLVRHVIG